MLWIKAFHIIFMTTWMAGLFYLPRLFVYHADASDAISIDRFKIMERRLYYGIMMPGALLTILFGVWMMSYNVQGYLQSGWMHAKLALVTLLIIYHLHCGHLIKTFKNDQNTRSTTFYRWYNELPTVVFIAIVIFVTVKPF